MKIFWGDIHNHCGITYGYGSLENALKAAKKQLDFCSVTPHAMWPDMPEVNEETEYLVRYHETGFNKIKANWEKVCDVVESANVDNEFITLHSFEMHSSKYGDHHVISPNSYLELLYELTPRLAVEKQKCPAIAIPHHIAYSPNYRSLNWDYFDNKISPVVEIYSKHGNGLKDDGDYEYFHTMGPRDSRSTAYSGLKQGKKFSFCASTDHHAGFPGSYGDGKIAVLAETKTRQSIWEAIVNGRTYAVTGDKILCKFSVNGANFGETTEYSKTRKIKYRVEGSYSFDKIVIYKNLKPIKVINGELIDIKNKSNRYKVRLELGWGFSKKPYRWNTVVKIKDGKLNDVELCVRGRSVLAPSPDQKDNQDINNIMCDVRQISNSLVEFDCDTVMNPSTTDSQTSAIILDIEGDEKTKLSFKINNRSVDISLGELSKGSITNQVGTIASPSFRIHRAVNECEFLVEDNLIDKGDSHNDFYHMEVRQSNRSYAFISPVYMD